MKNLLRAALVLAALMFASATAANAQVAGIPPQPYGECTGQATSYDGYIFWYGCSTWSCGVDDVCQTEDNAAGALYCDCLDGNNTARCRAFVWENDDGTVGQIECDNNNCNKNCSIQAPPRGGGRFYFCRCA